MSSSIEKRGIDEAVEVVGSSSVEEESRGGGSRSSSGGGKEARGEKGINSRARCINDHRERERERERETQHRSHGCLLGPSGTDPRTASVRTPYFCRLLSTLTSQSDGILTVCYRMLPNRGESSSVVTKPREMEAGVLPASIHI